jgi:outer membrane lipoprotein SlyB
MKKQICVALLAGASLLVTGCAPKVGGSDYARAGVGEVSETFEGVVLAKRVVQLNGSDPSKPGMGAVAGGVAGGVLGSTIGKGSGNSIATVAGALGGALAGNAIEHSATSQEGFEYQVKITKTQEIISIAQGAEPNLSVNQPVYVIRSNRGNSRVIPR